MREFWIIFKQAYITKAKAKSFIITTAIMVAAIFLFANITKIIDGIQGVVGDGDEPKTLYVIDESGIVADQLAMQLESSESGIEVEISDLTVEALTKQVTAGEIDSFLSVGLDGSNTITANYTTMSMMDISMPAMIQDALQSIQTEMKASELSYDYGKLYDNEHDGYFDASHDSRRTSIYSNRNEGIGIVIVW